MADTRFAPLRVFIVLVLGLALTACSQSGQTGLGMDHAAAGHTTTDPKAPFDQQFIDMMVPHHLGAVEMAKVGQARAERPEIRQMAGEERSHARMFNALAPSAGLGAFSRAQAEGMSENKLTALIERAAAEEDKKDSKKK